MLNLILYYKYVSPIYNKFNCTKKHILIIVTFYNFQITQKIFHILREQLSA